VLPAENLQLRTHAVQQTASSHCAWIALHVGAGFKPAPASINAQRPSSTPPFPAFARLRLFSGQRVFHHRLHTETRHALCEVIDCSVRLNEVGTIVQQTWDDLPTHYHGIDLDAFVVMPNHVHGTFILTDQSERRQAVPEIVRGFKTFSARRINEHAGERGLLWQRGYYEHVIRNENALDRIRAYIANNPAQWAEDPENISRAGAAKAGRV